MRCDEMLQLLAARKVKYPVFVISAHDTMIQREAIKECADQGLNVSYLSKPWTIEQLRALLLKHLGPGDNLAGNRHSA
jgi:response regulator of citrate/malate metabolism